MPLIANKDTHDQNSPTGTKPTSRPAVPHFKDRRCPTARSPADSTTKNSNSMTVIASVTAARIYWVLKRWNVYA
jgi:hypothetical protein